MQLDDPLIAAHTSSVGIESIGDIAATHQDVVDELRGLDPVITAATFGGLLTAPALQGNGIRIEALVHFAVVYCDGRKQPTRAFTQRSFERVGRGNLGRMEDPAENVFAVLVNTPNGNFRIFEGVREGTAFYLQRILNVIETIPSGRMYGAIRESVNALLKLSEAIAERAGVPENTLGQELPLESIPKEIADRLGHYRGLVRFSNEDLKKLGIQTESLAPFALRKAMREELPRRRLGNTELERFPLVRVGEAIYVLLPTAIASAITRFVIESVVATRQGRKFETSLANEYGFLFAETPLLGDHGSIGLHYTEIEGGFVAAASREVDPGRLLHLLFFVDGLNQFLGDGLRGYNSVLTL